MLQTGTLEQCRIDEVICWKLGDNDLNKISASIVVQGSPMSWVPTVDKASGLLEAEHLLVCFAGNNGYQAAKLSLNHFSLYSPQNRMERMADTSIEWTDATWNPVAGCSIMSAGCTNCYAMRMAARLEAMGLEKYKGLTRKSGGRAKWTGDLYLDESALLIPETWARPRNVFVNSMSDLFHPDVPVAFIRKVWDAMARSKRHTFQILTKRPDRMAAVLNEDFDVLPNVWLGTSVEDNRVLRRIDDLRRVPARIKFVSFEPLIGSVSGGDLQGIHWAIVGGESGPQARPMDPKWIDEIFSMCGAASTAFFFKQWGGKNKKAAGRIYRQRTWDEMPSFRI